MTRPVLARPREGLLALLLLLLVGAGPACAPRQFQPVGWSGIALGGSGEPVLLVADGRGYLLALNPGDGTERWRYPRGEQKPLGALYAAPAQVGERVVVGTYGGNGAPGIVHAVRLEDGSPLWQVETGGPIVGQAGVAGDRVLVPSSDGGVYALEAETGARLWRFETGNKVWSTPVARDALVYFGSLDHNLYAVDLETGREVWRFPTRGAIVTPPLLVGDRVVVGSLDRRLYAVDARTGGEVWRLEGRNWFWAGLAYDGTNLYAGDLSGTLYALDPATGQVRWRKDLGSPIVAGPVPVPVGVAVATDEGRFFVLGQGGEQRWLYKVDAPVRARPAVLGDVVYLVTVEGEVVALRTARGTRLWTVSLPR